MAALGVKIAANDLEKAVAGSACFPGGFVPPSTLGSFEVHCWDFLKDMKIPVMSIGLGPVYKRDVMKATTMLEKAPELAVMLCFDVKVDKEAEQYAEEQKIKIFNADIIYRPSSMSSTFAPEVRFEVRSAEFSGSIAVMPCVLKTLQIINKRNLCVDESDNLYSLISRRSIDTLKDPAFRDSVSRDDWLLIKKLKPVFDIK
ncbi:hypothetical protein E0198_004831 [Clavispora lusitaniae]|nr:hypothetical protein E0198_004831 [Clavispora lusitaniae]